MEPTTKTQMRVLAACIRANVPALLWGEPGTAKTATVESFGAGGDFHVETLIGGIREPSDFTGMPYMEDGVTHNADIDWAIRLSECERGILFLDEFTSAAPSVQRAMHRIVQERHVGSRDLGEHVAIVAAANPPDIATDGWDLSGPVSNRFCHIQWTLDVQSYLSGFATEFRNVQAPDIDSILGGQRTESERARVRGACVAFARMNSDKITAPQPRDPEQAGKPWPSPRTWLNTSKVLQELHPDDTDAAVAVVKGCVGEALAVTFHAWLVSMDLYDPEAVLDDPSIVQWRSDRPDRLIAMLSAVVALVGNDPESETWERAMNVVLACAKAGLPDVGFPALTDLLEIKPTGATTPRGLRDAYKDLMVASGMWKE